MAKFYSGITTGTTLDSMLAGGSEFGIFPSEDIDCSNINASGIHTVTGFLYPDGGIKDSSDSIGSAGKVLSSTGSGLAWIDPSTGSTANAVNVGTNLNSTNADQFVAFVGTSSGNNPIRVDAGIKYNPSTNVLSVPSITMSSHLNIDGNIRSVAGNLELQAVSGENGLVIKDNNAVELYFDGSATYKLATKTDGVDVRGELETDTLKVTGVSEFEGNVTIDGDLTVQGVGGFKTGMIILWSGAANAIPSGWVLCNGSNSTPDLRDRFVVGAGSGYSVGATGGAASVTLTVNQIPAHTHTHTKATHPSGSGPEQNQSGGPEDRTNFGDTGTTGSTGGGQSHENRPPYYALCYIMKT